MKTPKRKPISLVEALKSIPPGPFAVDPLKIGTPYNVETKDGRQSLCITNENPVGDLLRRNYQRHVAAEVIAHVLTNLPDLLDQMEKVINAATYPTNALNRRAIANRAASALAAMRWLEVTEQVTK